MTSTPSDRFLAAAIAEGGQPISAGRPPTQQTSDEQAQEEREGRFLTYIDILERRSVRLPASEGPYSCPCCGNRTLAERGNFEICEVCYWEDDGQDDHDAAMIRPCSPNGALSLAQARENFRKFGACEEQMIEHVRPPLDHEKV